jgi:hypothetical protein
VTEPRRGRKRRAEAKSPIAVSEQHTPEKGVNAVEGISDVRFAIAVEVGDRETLAADFRRERSACPRAC